MDVAARELKTKLSAYLSQASSGEKLTMTDPGRQIAVIGTPPGRVSVDDAVAAGWVQPPTRSGLSPVKTRPATGSVLAALADDRDE